MRTPATLTAVILSAATAATIAPAFAASGCGKEIQAIERRMQSKGASEVTGKPMNPDAKAQASNAKGQAPAPTNPAQKATPQKMADAQKLIDQAKQQEQAGNEAGCQKSMMDATKMMGAVP